MSRQWQLSRIVMPAPSRSKNGVAWLASAAAIDVFAPKQIVDGRNRSGHDVWWR